MIRVQTAECPQSSSSLLPFRLTLSGKCLTSPHERLLDGSNYLSWAFNGRMFLLANCPEITIKTQNATTPQERARALTFLRLHLADSLQDEYLTVDDPATL
ncbi:hypothetical protein BDK51DRAFT_51619 [Blyttiomyces helicus]|uniref:Uncharacterized protein n=1 Tax=Blyttiomyces helicus TaxID=388810 RepID=A0A4P9W1E6_9FUNG|nr:hypothetical protein BDK51DRAFT_51619 [Blyttiomyces helicus]|eukprot:RKO85165.1 hypothetical protein BDK51DRAFT_51619 [Blyttiomyces helicus]